MPQNPFLAFSLVVVTLLTAGFVSAEHSESLIQLLSDTAQSQIAQAGFFFTMAAWLHSGRVKKEIRQNFLSLTIAIDKVADAFREDLKAQGQRVDNLAVRVKSLEEKIN